MASLYEIRAALKRRLSTVTGLRVHAIIPDSIHPPAAFVCMPERVEFDLTFQRGCDHWSIPLRIAVSRATDRGAQAALDAYLAGAGASSLKAALEGSTDGADFIDTLRVREMRAYGVFEVGGVPYLGAELLLDIIA